MSGRAGPRLLFDTVRHLKPQQIVGRARHRLARPKTDTRPAPPRRAVTGKWTAPALRRQSLFGPGEMEFLNLRADLAEIGWDGPQMSHLWRYNQHYFDDLNAAGPQDRSDWHYRLVARWIAENPPGRGVGWEPYPTSLRIVNWIKRSLGGADMPMGFRDSLAAQARYLSRTLETHLLGNHLFANAKALVFAGLYFEGEEPARWLKTGLRILNKQIAEQILPDGGHFELSPMYHALALEDALDLINLTRVYPDGAPEGVAALADDLMGRQFEMRRWMAAMSHPDGRIAFFNDAAFNIAPPPAELFAYAEAMGLQTTDLRFGPITSLKDSGYIRLQAGPAVAILDVARVGPDYLPGHAHADTLSFELSLGERRVLINSGTSVYGLGPERSRQRGTPAHNTVTVDGADSSEVWAGFRVARRARPFGMDHSGLDGLTVTCAHDGYRRLKGRPDHRRDWRMDENGLEVTDTVTGGDHDAEARFHLHPDARLTLDETGAAGQIAMDGAPNIRIAVEGGAARTEATSWHPEFGLSQPNQCLVAPLKGGRATVRFAWD